MNLDLNVLSAGGGMLFAGGTNPRKAGLIGGALSWLIEKFTRSSWSHWAILMPQRYWANPAIPEIVESTEWNGVSGPQRNVLSNRLQLDYAVKGGHAEFLPFLPEFAPDWDALWVTAQQTIAAQKAGKLHYGVKRLFADATARNFGFAALPCAGILDYLAEKDHAVVCSEEGAILMQGGHVDVKVKAAGIAWLPNVLPIPGQPIGCSPQDLLAMPIWNTPVPVL